MASVKALQKAAFKLEKGLIADQSPGWGEDDSEQTLSTGDAFPYLSLGKGKTINTVEDESISTNGFKDTPRKTGEFIEKSLEHDAYFTDVNNKHFWAFGFENSIVEECCFTVTTPTIEPVAGAVYEDTDTNSFTFLRREVHGSTVYHVFSCDDGAVPTLSTGDLTKISGTGDATLSFTARSSLMYNHLYELDAHERHLSAYRTAEQITGYSSGDLKNRMATIGLALVNDMIYKNAMCSKWGISSSAGQVAKLMYDFVAHTELRGDYSSSGWTFPSGIITNTNRMSHDQFKVEVGESESTLVTLGVSDFDVSVEIPLNKIQDTISGLYLSEPVFEGQYNLGCNLTLSRHAANTYQDLMDAWTTVCVRISAIYGYYRFELLINAAKVKSPGASDDDVAKENLELIPYYTSTNNFATWLEGNTLIQNSPIILRVRDLSSTNQMFAN
jgi:hypothetical protein